MTENKLLSKHFEGFNIIILCSSSSERQLGSSRHGLPLHGLLRIRHQAGQVDLQQLAAFWWWAALRPKFD